MKLNIKQIEVFAAVMEHGSTTAASVHLKISQPSVSKHLKLLESNSGVNLFIRNNNRLIPTPEASALYEEIKCTYVGVSHLENFVRNLTSEVQSELGVGSISMLSSQWLPGVITRFLDNYDHYSISIPTGTHQAIATWVASGRVDLGICMKVGDEVSVDQELLIKLPHVCVLREDHEKAEQSVISSSDLDGQTLITLMNVDDWKSEKEDWRLAVQNKLDSEKVKPRNMISVSTSHHACELVNCGLGIALVDALTALNFEEKGLKWIPSDLDYTFDVYLITPKGGAATAIVSEFLDVLHEEAAKLDKKIKSAYPALK